MVKRLMLLFTACALVLGLSGMASAAPRTLKFSSHLPANDLTQRVLQESFFKPLEESGRWKVEYYPGGALGNTSTIVEGLGMGIVDMAMESCGQMAQFAPDLGIVEVPYLFNEKDAKALVGSPAWKELLNAGEKSGLKIVDFWWGFPREFISREPYTKASDFVDKKHRTTGARVHIQAAESLGVKPVPSPTSEVLTGLQQGVFDSTDYSLTAMTSQRLIDVAKNITMTNHAQVMGPIYCEEEWWEALPQEDKDLFTKAGAQYREALMKAVADSMEGVLDNIRKHGVAVHYLPPEEMDILVKKSGSIYDKLSDRDKELYRMIKEAIKK